MSLTDQAGVACERSPKGTGKTKVLKELEPGQRVLIVTHRAQLCRAICDRIGMEAEVPDAQS